MGDGTTLNTAALQKALDACGAAGGGTVVVPAGRFLTGPLTLVSSLNLHLEKGATLLMSDDPENFPITNNRFQDCLSLKKGHDVAITGDGTIDGQGAIWWANYVNKGPHRPFLVVITDCKRVLIQGVTLQNSPMFHLVPQKCQDVRIENVHIAAPETAKNTDGLDPSGWNFLITGCTFNVGDDCIALKPSARIDDAQPACKNFTIANCTFDHGHGLSIGGQTPGGLDGMTVRDCTFDSTDAGIRMKASRGSGGLVQNLTYENLTMKNVKVPIVITCYYNGNSPPARPAGPRAGPGTARRCHDADLAAYPYQARHLDRRKTAGQIFGLAEMPVSDVVLTNVNISAQKPLQIVHAQGIRFVNSHVTVSSGPPLVTQDAQVSGL